VTTAWQRRHDARQRTPRNDKVVPEEINDVEFKDRLPLIPTSLTSNDVRPKTVLAALMEAAPGDEPQESVEESAVMDAAIAFAAEAMSDEDIYVLNAIQFEDITFDELATRLGVARSTGWRLHKRALKRLQVLLLNHQPVRERLGMPETWNSAAMTALIEIAGYDEDHVEYELAEAVSAIDESISRARLAIQLSRENDAAAHLTQAGTYAVWYLRSVGKWSLIAEHELLCSKQNDYGHGNILKFGMYGVVVRASDKAERLKNLTALGGVKPSNESVLDTFFDVVGYAVIARMLKAETFELELEASDEPESEVA
jgi:DNA-directed RNA polymerase specialized sigma24 family protein